MKGWESASQALIILLIVIAAYVAATVAAGQTAWPAICCYWTILTAKNLCDRMAKKKGGPKGRLGVEDSAEGAPQTPYPANAEARLTGEKRGWKR